jgi:pyruvate/2-oxoglutarate dehydrogenase complex dihydrolipoamide acyltransferase (E2) component
VIFIIYTCIYITCVGQCICEIDTDVAEFEFNAQYDGYLAAQLVDTDDELQPGQEIAIQVDHKEALPYAQEVAKKKFDREHQHHHKVHKNDVKQSET